METVHLDDVLKVVRDKTDDFASADGITGETTYQQWRDHYGADSLDYLELILELEDKLHVAISDELAEEARSNNITLEEFTRRIFS
jgi:acyl carrier protein